MEFPLYDYDIEANFPRHIKPFRSATVCNANEDGIIVLGENDVNRRTELWSYKFARKSWRQMGLPSCNLFQSIMTPKPLLSQLKYSVFDSLLMFGHNIISAQDKFQLFTYNIKLETTRMHTLTGLLRPTDFGNETFEQARKHGNSIYAIGYQEVAASLESRKLKLFQLDLEKLAWTSSYELADDIRPARPKSFEFVLHENKLLAFVFDCKFSSSLKKPDQWQCNQTVNCLDLLSGCWSKFQTNLNPAERPNMKICNFVQNENNLYVVGGVTMGRACNKIWHLNNRTLQWSLLPKVLPRSKLGFMSDFTSEGQMYIAYDDGISQLNFAKRTRPLIDLCWEKAINRSDFSSIKEDFLNNVLLPEKLLNSLK